MQCLVCWQRLQIERNKVVKGMQMQSMDVANSTMLWRNLLLMSEHQPDRTMITTHEVCEVKAVMHLF